jgi:hypothetical protein
MAEHLAKEKTLRFIDASRFAGSFPRRLRAAYISLIPGLEYAPLSVHPRPDHLHIPPIQAEFPPFPAFSRPALPQQSQKKRTPLEELARRLAEARIPPVLEERQSSSPAFAPGIVTETMAQIMERQGLFTEAIKAYQVLARQKPDKIAYYEQKISYLKLLLSE